ncbi:hypothetical protein OG271_03160 [Micromonospora rifamycinica]|nr:hypothetical protein [Micromonospora rifamycinica]
MTPTDHQGAGTTDPLDDVDGVLLLVVGFGVRRRGHQDDNQPRRR